MQTLTVAIVLAVTLSLCAPASAVLVAPGQTVSVGVDADEYAPPAGDVLAQNSQDFVIDFDLTGTGYTAAGPTSFDATLTSSVVRDAATGRLTFVYQWDSDDDASLGAERNTFAVESFAGFSTDISIAAFTDWVVTRSADGGTINGDSVDVGGSLRPAFFIVTDATEFDANGTFSGTAGAEISVTDDEGTLTFFAPQSTLFTVAGTFQPVADDGGGNGGGGGGNVIPLPAGVWLGLVALGGGGAAVRLRRRLHLI
jgi:hypothetical protein